MSGPGGPTRASRPRTPPFFRWYDLLWSKRPRVTDFPLSRGVVQIPEPSAETARWARNRKLSGNPVSSGNGSIRHLWYQQAASPRRIPPRIRAATFPRRTTGLQQRVEGWRDKISFRAVTAGFAVTTVKSSSRQRILLDIPGFPGTKRRLPFDTSCYCFLITERSSGHASLHDTEGRLFQRELIRPDHLNAKSGRYGVRCGDRTPVSGAGLS